MTRTKTLLIVLFTLLIASAPTIAQSVVGSMFRLGSTSTASRPASGGSLTAGALMWDGDAGTVIYNDGNAWWTVDSWLRDAGVLWPMNGEAVSASSYIQSTRAFSSGDGIVGVRVRASGGSATDFTILNAAASGTGSLAYNSTTASMMVQQTSVSFAPIAQPHVTYNKQSFSTRILGVTGATGYPEIAERVATDLSGNTIKAFWGSTGTGATASVAVTGNRTYYVVQPGTEANSRYFGTTQDSASLGNLKPIVAARQSPTWCQAIQMPTTITNLRVWAGLVSTGTSTATSTMNGEGVMFRYDTTVDGLLYVCSRDGATQSCTSTGITVGSNGAYHLCLYMTSNSTVNAMVNGVHVLTKTTNMPTNTALLAPWVEIQILTGGTNFLAVGVMQTESY